MSRAAFSIRAFGFYMLALGLVLILAPNQLLAMSFMPTTTEVWIRVVGVLVFNIGVYYVYAARCEAKAFFHASVYTRTFVVAAFAAFWLLGLASPMLVAFGAVDFAGALWTRSALRSGA